MPSCVYVGAAPCGCPLVFVSRKGEETVKEYFTPTEFLCFCRRCCYKYGAPDGATNMTLLTELVFSSPVRGGIFVAYRLQPLNTSPVGAKYHIFQNPAS